MAAVKFRAFALIAVSGLFVSSCGSSSSDSKNAKPESAEESPVDLSILDTGKYATQPVDYGAVESYDEGRGIEARRMQEAIANPRDFDNAFTHVYVAAPVIDPHTAAQSLSAQAGGDNGGGTPVIEPVLSKYGMVASYVAGRSDKPFDLQDPSSATGQPRLIEEVLTRFPSSDAAANAAIEADAADFAVSSENVAVPISKYPNAHAHWRPIFPTMAATIAHGDFMISLLVANPTKNLQTLTGLIEKTIDLQFAALDKFKATAIDQIAKLPFDTERMFGRLLVLTGGKPVAPDAWNWGSLDILNGQTAEMEKADIIRKSGLVRVAEWDVLGTGSSKVRKFKDAAGVKTYLDWSDAQPDPDQLRFIDAPKGLANNAKCGEQNATVVQREATARFWCRVTFRNYVGTVYGGDETDVRQRAAAQYALLVKADK